MDETTDDPALVFLCNALRVSWLKLDWTPTDVVLALIQRRMRQMGLSEDAIDQRVEAECPDANVD